MSRGMNETSLTVNCEGLTLREANSQIKHAVGKGLKIIILNAEHLYGLASGLKSGEIRVKGDAHDFLGMFNHGAKIVVDGNVGNFAGDNSWAGEIEVKGDARKGIGLYAYGGAFVVHGNAGDAVGQILKGGIIAVGGNVGDNAGLCMAGGSIVIIGDAGKNLGHTLIGGTIYIGGKAESLGSNSKYVELKKGDMKFLNDFLRKYNIKADVERFKKIGPLSERPFYS
jgi:glutamate synthase domain-containing protein 3